MSWWQIALVAVPVWLTLAVVLALALGRAVRIRDRRSPSPGRPIPLDHAETDEWRAALAATEKDRED